MNTTRPPAIATWLLRHFGSSPNNENLLGDLAEQFRERRSRFWYWKQVLTTIAVSFFTEVATHKVLAARALAMGALAKLGLLFFWQYLSARPLHFQTNQNDVVILVYGAILACSARVVSRTSASHFRAMVLLYLLFEMIAGPAEFVLALFPQVTWLPLVVLKWATLPYESFYRLLSHFGYFSSIGAMCFQVAVVGLCILWGGRLLSASRSIGSSAQHKPASI